MAQIHISKIQLRRGPERDLPGAPTSTSPLEFSPGLDIGEIAFTTDTGRVFIGHDPQEGDANFKRATFPYQNIEVLTENSTLLLRRAFDGYNRIVETAFMTTNALINTDPHDDTDWRTLTLAEENGVGEVPFKIALVGVLTSAQVTYFLFDGNTPIRTGRLTVLHPGGASTPLLTDEATMLRRVDLGNADDPTDATSAYGDIAFRARVVADGGAQTVVIQYRNLLPINPIMCFRVERASPNNVAYTPLNYARAPARAPENDTDNGAVTNTLFVSGADTVIDSFGDNNLISASAKYVITVYGGQHGTQVSELLLVTDGTNAHLTEYGFLTTGGNELATFSVSAVSGTVTLRATATIGPVSVTVARTELQTTVTA